MNPPALATTNCRNCGNPFEYEPIVIEGRDFGLAVNVTCEACYAQVRADEEAAAVEAEKAARRAKVIATIDPELLPKDFDEDGTDLYHPEFPLAKYHQIRAWRPGNRGDWLALVGPSGYCKTRILALVAARIILTGGNVTWTTATRLNTESRNTRSSDAQLAALARQHLAECKFAPFLIIDDIGKNEWSPAFETHFFEILDHRKSRRLPVAYSANAHPKEFHLCMSPLNADPIIRRLLERTALVDFTPKPSDS
jgi:DNA replication protein DnaC